MQLQATCLFHLTMIYVTLDDGNYNYEGKVPVTFKNYDLCDVILYLFYS